MVGVPRLFLIDSFGFIFRAYHARARTGAPPMRTAAGVQTEAVYIFHNMVKRCRACISPNIWWRFLKAWADVSGCGFRGL